MTGDRVAEIAAREVEEMGGCVLPTESGMRAAFEWLAEQEGVRRDWYAEEVSTILAGIDAARRLLADNAALRGRLAAVEALHQPETERLGNGGTMRRCRGCLQHYPCTTRAALATGEGEDK